MAAVKILLLLALALSATASIDDGLQRYHRRRRGNRNGGRNRTPTPNRPAGPSPATPVPAPGGGSRGASPPPPIPPGYLLPCDRPDVPPVLAATAQNGSAGGTTNTPCIPRRTPPPPPQSRFRRLPLCVCPKPPGFGVPVPGGGGGGSNVQPDCVERLAPLMGCGPFLTGAEEETPKPQSDCCQALGAFVNGSRAATAVGLGDGGLNCLCPFIVGDVNRVMPRPIDPVRLMYLPIACGVVLPPQILFTCFTGHQAPQVVSKFSDVWL